MSDELVLKQDWGEVAEGESVIAPQVPSVGLVAVDTETRSWNARVERAWNVLVETGRISYRDPPFQQIPRKSVSRPLVVNFDSYVLSEPWQKFWEQPWRIE